MILNVDLWKERNIRICWIWPLRDKFLPSNKNRISIEGRHHVDAQCRCIYGLDYRRFLINKQINNFGILYNYIDLHISCLLHSIHNICLSICFWSSYRWLNLVSLSHAWCWGNLPYFCKLCKHTFHCTIFHFCNRNNTLFDNVI